MMIFDKISPFTNQIKVFRILTNIKYFYKIQKNN